MNLFTADINKTIIDLLGQPLRNHASGLDNSLVNTQTHFK